MTTEEMRKELEAAGYQFIANGYFAKDDTYTFRYEGEEVGSLNESIEKAYADLQQKRKQAALEDKLARILQIANEMEFDSYSGKNDFTIGFAQAIRKTVERE